MREGFSRPAWCQMPTFPRVHRWIIYGGILSVAISWVPLVLIARKRASKSHRPAVHIFLDMDVQPRYSAQDVHPLFADGRAMRPPVPGTVARGELAEDDHFYRGYAGDEDYNPQMTGPEGEEQIRWFDGYPAPIVVDRAFLDRGRERYTIYCSVCHSHLGDGNGMVNRRVDALREREVEPGEPMPVGNWVKPFDLHVEPLRAQPTGQLFFTITHGVRTMPSYGSQIPPEDRWAIVAYVKALQLARHAPVEALPEALKQKLAGLPRPEPPDDADDALEEEP